MTNTDIKPLMVADKLYLTAPIFVPDDRQLLSNPRRFLSDLYLSRTKRGVTTILRGISFTLNPGDRLGLIGANGAGKSTLLRMLAGIYAPSDGELTINGSTHGLFDIAMGMIQEATGLENIYLRGLQMGLSVAEIQARVTHIAEFAEIGDAIDKPFGTYSTGMRLRLAFAIATMVDPDILLLDEWIGAGDERFRRKAKRRMDELVENSRGLIIATHNLNLMKSLCTHGLVLHGGQVVMSGTVSEAYEYYEAKIKPVAGRGAPIAEPDGDETFNAE